MPVLLALSAFGPYVTGSIRTEQLAAYGACGLVLLLAVLSLRFRMRWSPGLVLPWLAFAFVATLGVVFPLRLAMPFPTGNAIAGMDNLLLPLAVMLTVWVCVPVERADDALRAVGKTAVWASAINGVVAVVNTRTDLSATLRPFWSRDDVIVTTAQNALELGRFGGIFNQPAEAGIMYGVAGLLAVYLYGRRPRTLMLALIPICLGGMLVVSKVFLLGGIPLILVYAWMSGKRGKTLWLFVVAAAVVAVIQSGYFGDFNYLLRLLAPSGEYNLIEFYTAGRWNAGSNVRGVSSAVMAISPAVGVGAGGWNVAYDSGWTEALIMAGVIGAVCEAAVFLAIFGVALRTTDPAHRRLTWFLAAFLLGANFGIGALTANRCATVVWLVLALLVLARLPAHQTTSRHVEPS